MAFTSNSMLLAAPAILAAPFVGSFVATLAYRLPRGQPIAWARSACPSCGARLGAIDLVPIFGWLLRRGHCRQCGAAIAWDYPLAELGALGIACWAAWVVPPGWPLWAVCGLGWVLLALALIDARHLLLPNVLTLPLVVAGLLVALPGDPRWAVAPRDSAIGAVAGYLVFMGLGLLYRRLRGRQGIGQGDAKLLAAAGAWAGWVCLPSVVLIAALSALAWEAARAAIRRRRLDPAGRIAFGVFLALGTWLVVLYGPLDFAALR